MPMSWTWRDTAIVLAWGLLYAALLVLPAYINVPFHVNVAVTPNMVYVFTAAWLLIPMGIVLLLSCPHASAQRKKSLRTALIALAVAYATVAIIGAATNMWQAMTNVLCNASNYYCLI